MSPTDIVRAWKDELFRLSLSEDTRNKLPENPAGLVELSEGELSFVSGMTFDPGVCGFTDVPCASNSATVCHCGGGGGGVGSVDWCGMGTDF